MILKQYNKFKTIVTLLIFIIGVSSGTIITPVVCMEYNGSVKIETGCNNYVQFESSANDRQNPDDHCRSCVDIPLSQYSPKIYRHSNSDIQNIVLDVITIPKFVQEQPIIRTEYTKEIFAINNQSQLAIRSTRLLL